ncbi:MAG: DUF1289 domain-containing protein [Pseudomonadota bacterium]
MSDPAIALTPIESPCIQLCTLDDQGLCIGCFRTSEEIGGWLNLSASRRREIIDELPARAERLFDAG